MIASTYDTPSLDAAAWFLEHDLRDSADSQRLRASGALNDDDSEMARLHEAAAARLEELADSVGELPKPLLLAYAWALEGEEDQGGPYTVHCSMTLEIGFALNPQSIEDVCKIYVRAIKLVLHDPRFAGRDVRETSGWNSKTRVTPDRL